MSAQLATRFGQGSFGGRVTPLLLGLTPDSIVYLGSFPLTVTVTTMGNRSYNSPLNKAPLRTVTGRGNDPKYTLSGAWGQVSEVCVRVAAYLGVDQNYGPL